MTFSFDTYKLVNKIVDKGIKFFGKHILEFSLGVAATAGTGTYICGKKMKEISDSKIEYNDWIIYKKGKFYYAKKRKNKIKIETNRIEEIKELIDKRYEEN